MDYVRSSGVLGTQSWEENMLEWISKKPFANSPSAMWRIEICSSSSLRLSFERIMERNADEESSWGMGFHLETEILFCSRLEGVKTLRGAVARS